jgi:hypothetical protein
MSQFQNLVLFQVLKLTGGEGCALNEAGREERAHCEMEGADETWVLKGNHVLDFGIRLLSTEY